LCATTQRLTRRSHCNACTQALLRAARDDVLFVRHAAGAKASDVVAAVAAAHRAAGAPQLACAALWQAGVPPEADEGDAAADDDASPGA
jgi:hypothetical protein